ncbi:hypothetical protein [Nonomuraea sp. NPDC049695]|uniref:hypothetical protein n=1 Tax=Nonomuraea sp. NPDC049695 TaxID=3154734 RepID=UPI00341C057E
MGLRRAPLLLAVALAAVAVAGPAAADRGPWPHPVPRVSVRPPAPPKGVTVGPTVSVPRVRTWRKPVPGVSISMPPGRRAVPKVTVPGVTIYLGGVCTGRVQVGECPRKVPHQVPHQVRRPVPWTTPVRAPTPVPTPKVTPRAPLRRQVAASPSRRRSPISTVLVMTVLVSAITSTTAVAFRSRR